MTKRDSERSKQAKMRGERSPLQILEDCGFIGSGSGPPDLSERYKEELSELLTPRISRRAPS